MKKVFIGITGDIGAGKDTAAFALQQHLEVSGKNCEIYRMAAPLKRAFTAITGMEYEETQEFKNKPIPGWGITVRKWLEHSGHSLRVAMPDFWINAMRTYSINADNEVFIIPDIRYQNEAQFIRERGGVLIHVDRPDNPHQQTEHQERLSPVYEMANIKIINTTKPELRERVCIAIDHYFPVLFGDTNSTIL